jgi:hypothetical protein
MNQKERTNMPFAYDIPQLPDDEDRDAYWRRKLKEDFEEEENEDLNEEENENENIRTDS